MVWAIDECHESLSLVAVTWPSRHSPTSNEPRFFSLCNQRDVVAVEELHEANDSEGIAHLDQAARGLITLMDHAQHVCDLLAGISGVVCLHDVRQLPGLGDQSVHLDHAELRLRAIHADQVVEGGGLIEPELHMQREKKIEEGELSVLNRRNCAVDILYNIHPSSS